MEKQLLKANASIEEADMAQKFHVNTSSREKNFPFHGTLKTKLEILSEYLVLRVRRAHS